MRTWKELWVSVVIQWVFGVLGIFIVEFLIRLTGGKREDPMPFVLFVLPIVFVNAVVRDLHKRLEDLRQRQKQMQERLDELERSNSGDGSELES
jgi:high-affinity Fe2+/Pb2+ permease